MVGQVEHGGVVTYRGALQSETLSSHGRRAALLRGSQSHLGLARKAESSFWRLRTTATGFLLAWPHPW